LILIDLKVGDRVLFGKWSGTEAKLDGEELLIMKESDIMACLLTHAALSEEAAQLPCEGPSPSSSFETRPRAAPHADEDPSKGATQMAAKDVKFSETPAIACCAARYSRQRGQVTLGLKGRNVVIDKASALPASPRTASLSPSRLGQFENMGAQMLREVAQDQRHRRRRQYHGDRPGRRSCAKAPSRSPPA
jgi:hypothetical protein